MAKELLTTSELMLPLLPFSSSLTCLLPGSKKGSHAYNKSERSVGY
jgi:hypothetical protein